LLVSNVVPPILCWSRILVAIIVSAISGRSRVVSIIRRRGRTVIGVVVWGWRRCSLLDHSHDAPIVLWRRRGRAVVDIVGSIVWRWSRTVVGIVISIVLWCGRGAIVGVVVGRWRRLVGSLFDFSQLSLVRWRRAICAVVVAIICRWRRMVVGMVWWWGRGPN
jgi:hypothetical protein